MYLLLKIEYGLKHGGMGRGKRARVSVHGIVRFTVGRCTGGTYFRVTLVKGCQKNRKIEKNTLFGNGELALARITESKDNG